MNETHVDEFFSPALDGELSPGEYREFRAHLEVCARCRAAFARVEQSVLAMRGTPIPVLSAADIEATVAAAFPKIAATVPRPAVRRPARWPFFLSHAAAALIGCTLMFGGQEAFFGGRAPSELPLPERIEVPVEVIREVKVPVEVPVEVIVEVPKEVIREVRVEVPVEVEVERVVVKRVPHPLQMRIDAGYGIAANVTEVAVLSARGLSGALEAAAAREAMGLADAGDAATEEAKLLPSSAHDQVLARGSVRGPGRARPGGGIVVLRDGERLSLRTRGPREVVVPALIDALDGSDPAVAAAALGQLLSIRERMTGAREGSVHFPAAASSAALPSLDGPIDLDRFIDLDGPIDRAGGLRGWLRQSRAQGFASDDAPPSEASSDAWRRWWRAASSGQ